MQKKSSKLVPSRASLYLDIRNNLRSFVPVARNGWGIKFSVYRGDNILIVFTSLYTGQTVLRYFTNEDDAVEYINFITEQDARDKIEA